MVFGPMVIGKVLNAQSLEHFSPLLRRTLFAVKRDDAPCHEIFARE